MMVAMSSVRRIGAVLTVVLATGTGPVGTQTRLVPDRNNYSLADDVRLGQEAAAQVRKELPLLRDDRLETWIGGIGRTLVAGIPDHVRHDGFRYTFELVNQKEINAFALPGGPMFLNRGMIEAAATEGEMAGVMAHEIAHVALRHGTAQATKGQRFQLGAIAGGVIGAIVGGTAGSIISQGTQLGLGTYFLRYGREYEREADLLGAQILARVGYDPRQMANMFKTIEAQGGRSGPEWLSSHPNPGNRFDAINREARLLPVQGHADSGQFEAMKARLSTLPAPPPRRAAAQPPAAGRGPAGVHVEPPARSYRTYQPLTSVTVGVPVNWDLVEQGRTTVTYAPAGGFVRGRNGRTAFTHGVQIGWTTGSTGNLQRDTEQLIEALAQANPQLQRQGGFRRDTIAGRSAISAMLLNVSDVTGQREAVRVSTAHFRDSTLLFIIGVAPQADIEQYDPAFRRVRQSVQIEQIDGR